ncbi:hypothetical protein NX059_002532 [Plenodomus lindquistii]|nr:hypothetical protein NX059_002532 [Plenodomus lindquistii]
MDNEKSPRTTTPSSSNARIYITTASKKPRLTMRRITLGQFSWYTLVATVLAFIKHAETMPQISPNLYGLLTISHLSLLACTIMISHVRRRPQFPNMHVQELARLADLRDMCNTLTLTILLFVSLAFFTPWVESWALLPLSTDPSSHPVTSSQYTTTTTTRTPPQQTFTPLQRFTLNFTLTWLITSEATYWYTRLTIHPSRPYPLPVYPETNHASCALDNTTWYTRLFPTAGSIRTWHHLFYTMVMQSASWFSAAALFWCFRWLVNLGCWMPVVVLPMGVDMVFVSQRYMFWGIGVGFTLARPVKVLHGAVFEWGVEKGVEWIERRRLVEGENSQKSELDV